MNPIMFSPISNNRCAMPLAILIACRALARRDSEMTQAGKHAVSSGDHRRNGVRRSRPEARSIIKDLAAEWFAEDSIDRKALSSLSSAGAGSPERQRRPYAWPSDHSLAQMIRGRSRPPESCRDRYHAHRPCGPEAGFDPSTHREIRRRLHPEHSQDARRTN